MGEQVCEPGLGIDVIECGKADEGKGQGGAFAGRVSLLTARPCGHGWLVSGSALRHCC